MQWVDADWLPHVVVCISAIPLLPVTRFPYLISHPSHLHLLALVHIAVLDNIQGDGWVHCVGHCMIKSELRLSCM